MAEPRELSARVRRRGLDFANRVSQLALEAPDVITKREVYKAARAIEKMYGFSQDEKKQYLLRLVSIGAASHNELVAESGFRREVVDGLIAELESDGFVRLEMMSSTRGRPAMRIFRK